MKKKVVVIDCCALPLSANGDSRVKFVHDALYDGFIISTVRNHCPLSVAMNLISVNQVIPNGVKDSYLIEPETVDTAGHVEA